MNVEADTGVAAILIMRCRCPIGHPESSWLAEVPIASLGARAQAREPPEPVIVIDLVIVIVAALGKRR
jgi:hypothetical protein